MRELVVIVASHYRQAELVCRQLDLPLPNRVSGDVIVVYAGPNDQYRLMGTLIDRLIIARPTLVSGVDRAKLSETREIASHRFARRNAHSDDGREIEYVTT